MERFDTNLLGFYTDVQTIVPELFNVQKEQNGEEQNTSELNDSCVDIVLPEGAENRLLFFVNNWYPHMEAVSQADLAYFSENEHNPAVFPKLSFLSLMAAANEKNKAIIWDYLHSLFALSISTPTVRSHLAKSEEKQDDESDEQYESRKTHLEKIAKTIDDFPVLIGNMVAWKRARKNEEKERSENNQDAPRIDEKFLESSSLTRLAQEISDEINPEEILNLESGIEDPVSLFKSLLSGDESSGIGKLMKTVTNKLKNKMESGEVNQQDLFRDANILLQNLGQQNTDTSSNENKSVPNLTNIMSMAQNLASLSNLFGDMKMPSQRQQQNVPSERSQNRKFKKRMRKAMKKAERKKEAEEASTGAQKSHHKHQRRKKKARSAKKAEEQA